MVPRIVGCKTLEKWRLGPSLSLLSSEGLVLAELGSSVSPEIGFRNLSEYGKVEVAPEIGFCSPEIAPLVPKESSLDPAIRERNVVKFRPLGMEMERRDEVLRAGPRQTRRWERPRLVEEVDLLPLPLPREGDENELVRWPRGLWPPLAVVVCDLEVPLE